jgi:RHS repeat-associated protein
MNDGLLSGYTNEQNKYKYQSKERDLETNYDYFEARYYDSSIARFLQPDPHGEKYKTMSFYTGMGNNPFSIIDTDGKDIKAVQGKLTASEFKTYKATVLQSLQKLTNDKIAWKGNSLIISKLGGQNSGKELSSGTSLIRTLNQKGDGAKTTSIQHTDGANSTNGFSTSGLTQDGKKGEGSDATVNWNPDKKTGGVDINGSNERPAEIGLGHELGHAESINQGKADLTESGVKDPDGSGEVLTKEELNARAKENALRKEQELPLRKIE